MRDVPRTMRRWYAPVVALGVVAAVYAATVVMRGGSPELIAYTSPPLDTHGSRLTMLVPAGWVTKFNPPTANTDASVMFWPRYHSDLVQYIRGMVGVASEEAAGMMVWFAPGRVQWQAPVAGTNQRTPCGRPECTADWSAMASGPTGHRCMSWYCSYTRTDRTACNRTQAAIGRSVMLHIR